MASGSTEYSVVKVLNEEYLGINYIVNPCDKDGNTDPQVNLVVKEFFIRGDCSREPESSLIVIPERKIWNFEKYLQAFLSNAQSMLRLGYAHPNIAPIYDVFQANNTGYYVRKYYEGCNLEEYVQLHGAMTQAQMEGIIHPIADGVSFLHHYMMEHLDIKPTNIIISREDDGRILPILVDYRQGCYCRKIGENRSMFYIPLSGKPYTLIPDVFETEDFSHDADVYALATTILFCLTGQTPKESMIDNSDNLLPILDGLNISPELRGTLISSILLVESKSLNRPKASEIFSGTTKTAAATPPPVPSFPSPDSEDLQTETDRGKNENKELIKRS